MNRFIFRNKYTNPIFFIVSNDLKWSMENIMGDDIIYPGTLLEQLTKTTANSDFDQDLVLNLILDGIWLFSPTATI